MRPAALIVACLTALSAAADVQVAVISPGTTVDPGVLTITLDVVSTHEVSAVTARVGSRTAALVRTPPRRWSGTLDASGLPPGPASLDFTVTDVAGQTHASTRALTLDAPPVAEVLAPVAPVVAARPSVALHARCRDADPCFIVATVRRMGAEQDLHSFEATNELQQTVCVDDRITDELVVTFTFRDAAHVLGLGRLIVVERGGMLEPVARFPGQLHDVTQTRALYLDADGGWWTAPRGATGAPTWLGAAPTGQCQRPASVVCRAPRGVLTSNGAVTQSRFSYSGRSSEAAQVTWLRADAGEILLGYANTPAGVVASEAWVAWSGSLVDLRTSARFPLADASDFDVKGDRAVFVEDGGLFEQTDGGRVLLYQGTGPLSQPRIDGTTVFVAEHRAGAAPELVHVTPSGVSRASVASPIEGLAVRGGFAAFGQRPASGPLAIWLSAPDGGARRLTWWDSDSTVEDIDPDGDVLYRVNDSLHRVSAAGLDDHLAGPRATGRWVDGRWTVLSGDWLFAVRPDAGDSGPSCPAPSPQPRPSCAAAGSWLGLAAFALLVRRRRR